jgi:phenylalanyl-tRNA synthetase alpha subunit
MGSSELPNLLRGVAQLAPEQRGTVGKAANQARQALERALETRARELADRELQKRLVSDRVDVTLPADPLPQTGRLHLRKRAHCNRDVAEGVVRPWLRCERLRGEGIVPGRRLA